MEVLVVVAILVVLAGVGGVVYMKVLEDGKKDAARAQVEAITTACQIFQRANGDWPSSLADLTVPGPDGRAYLEQKALIDPWNKQYQYNPVGDNAAYGKPDIWTTTPAGETVGNTTRAPGQ
jgi:type II secretory pathway pseudopilin PulG